MIKNNPWYKKNNYIRGVAKLVFLILKVTPNMTLRKNKKINESRKA